MNRTIFSLCALAAAAAVAAPAQAQQARTEQQVIVGHPITRRPPQNPPTLPLRTPVKPVVPNNPQQHTTRFLGPIYYPVYQQYPYQAPPQNNVNVNVTNVVETPPAVTMIAPVMVAPGYDSNVRLWDADADLAAERAAAQPVDAEPTDVKSAEAIVGALYDVLSGPRGTARNWGRFKSLFAEGAHLIATRVEGSGPARPTMLTPDEYAATAGPALEGGVYQREVSHTTQQFGAIAHVFSTYECRHTTSDEKPFQRGINSIQLLNDGTRWWIISVSWDAERPGMPIPPKYLAK